MRKALAFSVIVLVLTFVTGSLLAGDTSDCDIIKENKEFKRLYGLCVAYQNADEEGRRDIFANWEKKAGPDGPRMPNHPYEDDEWISECLCWAGRTQTQICDLGDRFFLPNPGNGGALYVDDFTASPMVSNLFIAFDSYCEYEYGVMGDPEASFQFDLEDLSLDNAIQCVSEVEVMGSPEFCDP